jgi:hypothetical protein
MFTWKSAMKSFPKTVAISFVQSYYYIYNLTFIPNLISYITASYHWYEVTFYLSGISSRSIF